MIVNIIFPGFEVKNQDDVFDIANKILQYPYNMPTYIFTPIGAPNTWTHVVWFIDWLCDMVQSMLLPAETEAIAEESDDDHFRRSSMDHLVYLESSQFFDHLANVPKISPLGKFMWYVEKFRSKKKYEETNAIDSKDSSSPDTLLKDRIEKIKLKIEEMDARQEDIIETMNNKRIKKQRVIEMEQQQEQLMIKTKSIQDTVEYNKRSIDQKKAQNDHIEKEIEKIRDEIKEVQTSINQQMLTSYEKEIAEQEIKALHDKKISLENN